MSMTKSASLFNGYSTPPRQNANLGGVALAESGFTLSVALRPRTEVDDYGTMGEPILVGCDMVDGLNVNLFGLGGVL